MNTNNNTDKPEWFQDADLVVNIVRNDRGYAFAYTGPRVLQQSGSAYYSKENDNIEAGWYALVSVFRSLTERDKRNLYNTAVLENRRMTVIVNSRESDFIESINTFNALDCGDLEHLRDLFPNFLLDRIEGFRQDLDFEIVGNLVDTEFVPLKRTFGFLMRTVGISPKDPRSKHTMPRFYGSTDARILNPQYRKAPATAPALKPLTPMY